MDIRKVVGMGETVLDILFKEGKPVAAVPGGSSFNAIVSVGRVGVPCHFIGTVGKDEVGKMTVDFMQANGVDSRYFERSEEKSAVSLAFLDASGDAHYSFYKPSVKCPDMSCCPPFSENDVLLFGSYYACSCAMRPFVTAVMNEATRAGAILYYDLNFRRNHAHEIPELLSVIEANMRQSTVVRCSTDDLEVLYGLRDAEEGYRRFISPHCRLFICTSGSGTIKVCTPDAIFSFPVPDVRDVVSTVGAGDSFNAGFSCALLWQGISRSSLSALDEAGWRQLLETATAFSSSTCRSSENYVPVDFRASLNICLS